jgi:hypothetical protein
VDSSLFAFFSDFAREGADGVLDRVKDHYGAQGITVAAAYHQARDVTPHGAARLVMRRDGAHFLPDPELFSGLRLRPPCQDDAQADPLRGLCATAAARGLAVHGWTVFCHNTTLGMSHPDCAAENCFGDRAAPADLCPANPEVRAYAIALARNVARYGVDTVVAESLHYGTFGHGYHHERSFVTLGALDRYLFGLCFCPYCMHHAESSGVAAQEARSECAAALTQVLGDGRPGPEEVTAESIAHYAGRAAAQYAESRRAIVTHLVADVAAAVAAEGSALVFLDQTGAVKGYADGRPSLPLAADDAWQLGIDPAQVSRVVSGYAITGYVRDAARLAREAAVYRRACGRIPLRVVLRPGPPDTLSERHLAQKVSVITEFADAIDFYHYGLNTLPHLDRIRLALRPDDHRRHTAPQARPGI